MAIQFSEINFLAILIAALANFMIGGLWFSPMLFARSWVREIKISEEDLKKGGNAKIFFGAFLLALISAAVLALFINATQANTPWGGALVGFLSALGFVATSIATNYLFEKKSYYLFLITAGHHVATFVVMGIIIGYWH